MCISYHSDLTKQIDRFSREIELAQIQENNNLNNLLQDQKKLFRLQERVGWLRYITNPFMSCVQLLIMI